MKICVSVLFGCALSASTAFSQGRVLWDESVNGPLSFDYQSPTALGAVQPGTNSVVGSTEIEPTGPGYLVREDCFIFTVPGGSSIGGVWVQITTPNVVAWIGDQRFSTQVGYSADTSNGDLLLQWGLTSLGPDTYGMYVANHNFPAAPSIASYRLDFLVQTIPEPSGVWLGVLGISLVGLHRRRRVNR